MRSMQKTKPSSADRLRPPEMRFLSISVRLPPDVDDPSTTRPSERVLIASPRHTFADLALAIDEAFGRWELGQGRQFCFADGSRAGEEGERSHRSNLVDDRRARLYRLREGERFVYVVDNGVRFEHECTVVGWLDPDDVLFDRPSHPVVYQAVGRSPALAAAAVTPTP